MRSARHAQTLATQQLLSEFGSLLDLKAEVRPRIAAHAKEVTGRDLPAKRIEAFTSELVNRMLERWDEAEGNVPRLRRELPPETWSVACTPDAIVKDWNARASFYENEPRGALTVEELLAEPAMTPREFVDWNVEWGAWYLEQQMGLTCTEILFFPPAFVGLVAWGLSRLVSPWIAIPVALILVVPFMVGWYQLRRRGYVSVTEGD